MTILRFDICVCQSKLCLNKHFRMSTITLTRILTLPCHDNICHYLSQQSSLLDTVTRIPYSYVGLQDCRCVAENHLRLTVQFSPYSLHCTECSVQKTIWDSQSSPYSVTMGCNIYIFPTLSMLQKSATNVRISDKKCIAEWDCGLNSLSAVCGMQCTV